MQNDDVNARNVIDFLVTNFGEDNVSTCDAGVIKLQKKALASSDLLSLSMMLRWSDVYVKRSGTGLVILCVPKEDSNPYSEDVLKALETIQSENVSMPETDDDLKD